MPSSVQKTPIPKVAPRRGAACAACNRAAFFQARIEYPAGSEFIRRRANACSSHLVDVIQALRAWARARQLTRGSWLTVLAIDPYALPRLTAVGVADPGFVFYSAPVARSGVGAQCEQECHRVEPHR